MWTILSAFLSGLLVVLALCTWLESSLWWIPGPWGIPRITKSPHRQFTSWSLTYGTIFSVRLGTWSAVIVNGYDAVKDALISLRDDFAGRPDFESYKHYAGGKSLSFSPYGAQYKKHRLVVMQTLKHLIEDSELGIHDIIHNAAENLVDSLMDSPEIDPSKPVHMAVGSILYSLCFGQHMKLQNDNGFCQMVLSENPSTELFGAGHQDDLLPSVLRSAKYRQGLLHMAQQLQLHDAKLQQCLSLDRGAREPCILESLTRMVRRQPTLAFLHNATVEFISAGSETSSSVLLWLILYMAEYPEVQARVHDELDAAYSLPETPSADDLPFTQACIWEVMRLNTIVPFALPHSTIRNTRLQGRAIPKNTLVFINLWSVCRDSKIWKRPNDFCPERFLLLDENGKLCSDMDKLKFLFAFGAGHRRCIGEALGKRQVSQLFIYLLKHCQIDKPFSGPADLEAQFGDVLRPKSYKVKVSRRARNS